MYWLISYLAGNAGGLGGGSGALGFRFSPEFENAMIWGPCTSSESKQEGIEGSKSVLAAAEYESKDDDLIWRLLNGIGLIKFWFSA